MKMTEQEANKIADALLADQHYWGQVWNGREKISYAILKACNAATEASAAQVASEATEEYRKMFADLMNFMVDTFHQDPLRDEGAVEMATRLLAYFKNKLASVTKERDEWESKELDARKSVVCCLNELKKAEAALDDAKREGERKARAESMRGSMGPPDGGLG